MIAYLGPENKLASDLSVRVLSVPQVSLSRIRPYPSDFLLLEEMRDVVNELAGRVWRWEQKPWAGCGALLPDAACPSVRAWERGLVGPWNEDLKMTFDLAR